MATPLKVFNWNNELTIGGIICNDMWASPDCTPMPDVHVSQQLSQKGAKILFHAVNGGRNGDEWSKVIYMVMIFLVIKLNIETPK